MGQVPLSGAVHFGGPETGPGTSQQSSPAPQQLELQQICPLPQLVPGVQGGVPQVPLLQYGAVPVQAWPQVPQLLMSLLGFTQVEPQHLKPMPHPPTHPALPPAPALPAEPAVPALPAEPAVPALPPLPLLEVELPPHAATRSAPLTQSNAAPRMSAFYACAAGAASAAQVPANAGPAVPQRITGLNGSRNWGNYPSTRPQEPRVKTRKKWIIGGAVTAVLAIGFLGYLRSAYGPGAAPDGSASASPSALAAPLGSALLGDGGTVLPSQMASEPTLAKAIAITKPEMDDTLDKLDEGSALLALWASKYMSWDDLMALPETTPALFRKDPGAERGHRLCETGKITEIRAETTLARRLLSDHAAPLPDITAAPAGTAAPTIIGGTDLLGADAGTGTTSDAGPLLNVTGPVPAIPPDQWVVPDKGKVFFAVLTIAGHDPKGDPSDAGPLFTVSAIAVRNTDKLVEGSTATICGVLTGVNEMTLADGSNVVSHRIVGLFDLPDNRAAPPQPPASAASTVAKPAPSAKPTKPKEG